MIGSVYRNISDCTLKVFITVLITGNVRNLVRWGFFKSEELARIWDDIFDEYLRESNEGGYANLLRKMKDISVAKNKVRLSVMLLNALELKYNKDLVDVLRLLGYRYKFDPKDRMKYFNDLERVRKDVKNLMTITKDMEEKLRGREKNEAKETDFDSLLIELGRFQGYRIDKNVITVSEFLQTLKNYKLINKKKDGKFGKNR